jgi:hypothetical protein
MSQAALAGHVGISPALLCRMERGQLQHLDLDLVARICTELGARLVAGIDVANGWSGVRQRDAGHSRCVGHVARRLENLGWSVRREVRVGEGRSLGWIDVLAYHPRIGVLLVIEVKTELHDLGEIERRLDVYERGAWAAARALGWQPRRLVGCLLLLATAQVDERIRANRDALAGGFQVRARALNMIVTGAQPDTSGRGLALIDPRSRARDWLRPTTLDGRRSPASYRDYGAFIWACEQDRRQGR